MRGAADVDAEDNSKPSTSSRRSNASAKVKIRKPVGPDTLREKIYATMEDPGYSVLAKIVAVVMMLVILVSTVCFVLESEVCQSENCSDPGTVGHLEFYPAAKVFYVIEWISVVIFTLDYCTRLATCPRPLVFVMGVMNLVDLVAWLPFWIMGCLSDPAFAEPSLDETNDVGGVGFVRAVRLIRVFRVFKVGKYSLGIQMFGGAIARSAQPMAILVLVLSVAMIIFSSIIWLVEKPGASMLSDELLIAAGRDGEPSMQGICFGTIPSAFWWALTTMTTVGYGDCYPITWVGNIVATVAMIGGVIVLALPITVLGSNFAKMVEMYEEDAAQYAFADLSGDALVDELELREFLNAKKKEGLLKNEVEIEGKMYPVKVSTLMEKFDSEEQGALNLSDFRRLQQEVTIQKAFDPQLEMQLLKDMLSLHHTVLKDLQSQMLRICEHQQIPLPPGHAASAEDSGAPEKEADSDLRDV